MATPGAAETEKAVKLAISLTEEVVRPRYSKSMYLCCMGEYGGMAKVRV
jgi:hypothetical protein